MDDAPRELQDNPLSRARRVSLENWLRRELQEAGVGSELTKAAALIGAVLIERVELVEHELLARLGAADDGGADDIP